MKQSLAIILTVSFLFPPISVLANNDRILTIDPTEGVLYNIEDHLSSASLIVKPGATPTIIQKLDYYPYGTERVNEKTTSFSARHTFTDKEKDTESGLQYFGARYYNPSIGRFTSVDPASIGLTALNIQLADPQSWNSYTYARNNPLILKDDTGRFWQIAAGATIGAVVSGGLTYYQTGDINQSLHASAGGAVQGALIAFAGPATLLQTVGAGAGATAIGNSLSRTLDGSAVNAQTLALDAGAGAVGGAIGYGAGKAMEYGVGRVGGKVVGQSSVLVEHEGSMKSIYRGGEFNVGLNELKIDSATGMIRADARGMSLNINPNKAATFGKVSQVTSLPEGLALKQVGKDLGHFEVVTNKQMSIAQYKGLIGKIGRK